MLKGPDGCNVLDRTLDFHVGLLRRKLVGLPEAPKVHPRCARGGVMPLYDGGRVSHQRNQPSAKVMAFSQAHSGQDDSEEING